MPAVSDESDPTALKRPVMVGHGFSGGSRDMQVSPLFVALVALTAVSAWLVWANKAGRFGVFLFVVAGWLVSLCLHEFAHARVAYHGGDHSVAAKGYLRLDIRRYQHPLLSFVLPVVFLLSGGIGLPGGAVWLNQGAIRRRWMRSLASLAGPLTNAACAVACLLPFAFGAFGPGSPHGAFAAGLAFLGVLQISACVLNLLPVPGFDGWGALEPYLSPQLVARGREFAQWGFIVVFFLVFRVPAFARAWGWIVYHPGYLAGVPRGLASAGYVAMKFWQQS